MGSRLLGVLKDNGLKGQILYVVTSHTTLSIHTHTHMHKGNSSSSGVNVKVLKGAAVVGFPQVGP